MSLETLILASEKHRLQICHIELYYHDIFFVGIMYSGEYDACDVTLSVYPHVDIHSE